MSSASSRNHMASGRTQKISAVQDHLPCYDRIRVLAAICVIITHTIQNDLDSFPSDVLPAANAAWLLTMVCNILYVALSGALLYGWRDESPWTFYRKRLIRTVLPMWICDLIVQAARAVLLPDSETVSFPVAILHLLTGQTPEAPQYWLIYLILSLYITMPFFRWLFKDLSWKMQTGLIIVCMGFLSLRYILSALGQPFELQVFVPGWLFISFLGYYLCARQTRRYALPIMLAGLGAAVVMVILCLRGADQAWIARWLCNDTPLMILWGSGLFMLLLRSSRPESRLLRLLSRYSYSIILLHWAVMRYFLGHLFGMHAGGRGWIAGTLLCSMCNLLISLGLSIVIDALIIHPLQKLCARVLRTDRTGKI